MIAKRSVLLLLFVALTACAQLGIVAPQTAGELTVYGYSMNAQVRRGAAEALKSKAISKSDAQHVLRTTNTTRAALDEAVKAVCPDSAVAIFQARAEKSAVEGADLPACMNNLPESAFGKLKFAVGLVNQAALFLQSFGVMKNARIQNP